MTSYQDLQFVEEYGVEQEFDGNAYKALADMQRLENASQSEENTILRATVAELKNLARASKELLVNKETVIIGLKNTKQSLEQDICDLEAQISNMHRKHQASNDLLKRANERLVVELQAKKTVEAETQEKALLQQRLQAMESLVDELNETNAKLHDAHAASATALTEIESTVRARETHDFKHRAMVVASALEHEQIAALKDTVVMLENQLERTRRHVMSVLALSATAAMIASFFLSQ